MAWDRTLLEQAFDQFPQALLVVDHEATVRSLNAKAERLTGFRRSVAVGRPAADVLDLRSETGDNLCAPRGALRRVLSRGARLGLSPALLFRPQPGGEPLRVACVVSPLRREKGVGGAVIAIHDVTPELEAIEARDAQLLAASHELRTPLTTLKGLSELLLDMELTDSQRRELLQDLHGQAERMERLIGEMLRAGQAAEEPPALEVSPTMSGVREAVRPLLGGRPLRYSVPERLPPVRCQARTLHQILLNLVTNAIKYSTEAAPITLTVSSDRAFVRFDVSDQGLGIRREHLSRVFDKFYRADEPAVQTASGMGVGLHLVRNLVDRLGGEVHVRSRYGKGSVFRVSLPRADVARPRSTSTAAR